MHLGTSVLARGGCGLLAVAILLLGAFPAPAADDPPLSVPEPQLAEALTCTPFGHPEREPVLLVHGTGATPEENWGWNYLAVLPEIGFDVCTVRLPDRALGDIQVSSEYVVHAVRTIAAASGRKVDVLGHSQGGLQPRWAVRWWASARDVVDDLVTLGSPHHGTVAADLVCVAGCQPAVWQMRQGSRFLAALNAGDETPGDVDYTSIYSVTDELVQPAVPEPVARLDGGATIAVQDVCPGRPVEHAALAGDAATYELVIDALTNPGPADPARFPAAACARTAFDGVTPVELLYLGLDGLQGGEQFPSTPPTAAEPPLAPYAAGQGDPAPSGETTTTTTAPSGPSDDDPRGGGPAVDGAELPATGSAAWPAAGLLALASGLALRRRS